MVLALSAVARCRDAAAGAALARILASAEWDALFAAAKAHGMLGLLYRRATDRCPDVVPEVAVVSLAAAYRASATRGLRQEARLLDVIERLRDVSIACVPFKGPSLARLVYGDVALRYATDLDVLVTAVDVARAAEVLVGVGWRLASHGQTDRHDLLEDAECELLLEHLPTGLFLELHWRTGPRITHASFAAEGLIAAAEACDLLGREVACLRNEDHFLVLCAHGATHRWDQLEMISAVAEFINCGLIEDWLALLARAGQLGCRRRVLVAAALTRGLAGAELPPVIESALADDPGAERLALAAAAALVPIPGPRVGVRRLADIAWQAQALDTPGARLLHLVERVVIPGSRDLDWLTVPRSLSAVYYLLRPLRILAEHGRRTPRTG